MADGPGVDASWSSAGDQGIGGHLAEGRAGETAERARDDQFSAWLRDREPALQAGDETFSWLEPNRQAAQARQTPETSWSPGGSLPPPEPADGLAGQPGRTRTGIDLAQGTGSASAAAPRSSAAPTTPATPARPATATGPAAGLGSAAGLGPTGLGPAGSAAGKRSAGTGQAVTSGIKVTVAAQPRRQPSRVLSVRLLLLVIVAALLGSMLVMLLR
jgi:hypothetical protein